MSTAPQTPQPATKNQNRRKKARAIMASGLVLGVGAAVTLAAWSDTVWGAGTFGTAGSDFNIQGNFTGTEEGWDEFVTADDAGPMTFTKNANALIPGVPVYQLVGLRETKENLGADITLTRTTSDAGKLANLVKVAVADAGTALTAPTCDATATFGTATAIGAAMTDPVLTTDVEAGGYRWLCFSATLDAGATLDVANVTSEKIQWQFAATSQDPV